MPTPAELLAKLIAIKDEINRQIPLATNRFEEFECVPANLYRPLSEEEQHTFDEKIYQALLRHEEHLIKMFIKFSIHKHLSTSFVEFLKEKNIEDPAALTALQLNTFKANSIKDATLICNKTNRTRTLLGKSNGCVPTDIEAYLTHNIEQLIKRLQLNEPLHIEENELEERFIKDERLADHREIAYQQFSMKQERTTKDFTESLQQKIDKLHKSYNFNAGIYYDDLQLNVGYCDEHATLALLKIYDRYLVKDGVIIEKISITYYDENNHENDGHTFLAINRDPESKLEDIENWGDNAIIFDAWNKLVCFAKDIHSQPFHYFSYPDGAQWETLKFNDKDYSLWGSIRQLNELFLVTGNSNQQKREQLLIEEYQLYPLSPSTQCRHFIVDTLQKLIPNNFHYNVEVFITTGGDQPVKVLSGFSDPKIAIHLDFLQDITNGRAPVELLEFGLVRALYFIRHFALINEYCLVEPKHLFLDKLALEHYKNGMSAIQYLRYCLTFEKAHEEEMPFNMEAIDDQSVLSLARFAYLPRIKHVEMLLAQVPKLRYCPAKLSPPNNFLHELNTIKKQQRYFDLSECKNPVEQIHYLEKMLPTLTIELLPFELTGKPSIRLREFCYWIKEIKINLSNPDHLSAVDQLINKSIELRTHGIELIYTSILNISKEIKESLDKMNLIPLGLFRNYQMMINKFVHAADVHAAREAAEQMQAWAIRYNNHFEEFNAHQAAKCHLLTFTKDKNKLPTGSDRYFGSSLGWHITWEGFSSTHNMIPWSDHLKWSKQDSTGLIALTLWRLGVVNDTQLWNQLGFNHIVELLTKKDAAKRPMIEMSGDLAIFGDNYFLSKAIDTYVDYASSRHDLQTAMFDDQSRSFESAFIEFYDANLPALLITQKSRLNIDNVTIQFLLHQFARIANEGSSEDKNVVKSFYLGREDDRDLRNLMQKINTYCYLPSSSPYISFFVSQQYEGVSFQLFTPDDFMQVVNLHVVSFRQYEIPAEKYIRIFNLPDRTLDLSCVKKLLTLLNEKSYYVPISYIIQAHIDICGPFPIFSYESFEIAELIQKYIGRPYKANQRKKLLKNLRWPNTLTEESVSQITLSQLIFIYRLIDSNLSFPDNMVKIKLGKILLAKIAELQDVDETIQQIEQLLFVTESIFTIPPSDLQLRNALVSIWEKVIITKYGKDINSLEYHNKIKPILANIINKSSNRDAAYILNRITIAIQSQKIVSEHVGILLEPEKYLLMNKNHSRQTAVSVLSEVSSCLGKERADQLQLLNFLSSPLSTVSVQSFSRYLIDHDKIRKIAEILGYTQTATHDEFNDSASEHIVQLLYHLFWDRNLEERAVIINYLLLPPDTVINETIQFEAYQKAFTYVADKLFQNAYDPISDDNVAVAFLKAYLETADNFTRSYLLAGMLVTSCEAQLDDKPISVGKKLALLCEHLGPAYVKLAQAIHSYPQTPEAIKQDLGHIKGRANPPNRWRFWRILTDTLPTSAQSKISRVGNLLGSASYNMAFEVTLKNGDEVVLLLLRENAEKDAVDGFKHLHAAIKACQHQRVTSNRHSLLSLTEEAAELSRAELDQKSGDKQYEIASAIYPGSLTIKSGESNYYVTISPAKCFLSGPGFRIIERKYGIEFNDLPKATAYDLTLLNIVAKAVMIIELTRILSGSYFDCDRHGNQLRVFVDEEKKTVILGLYDFGEMAEVEPDLLDMQKLKNVIQTLPFALLKGDSLDSLLSNSTHFLLRVRKALLALQDFQKYLSTADLIEVMNHVAKSPLISPILKDDLTSALNKINLFHSLQQTAKATFTTFWNTTKSILPIKKTQNKPNNPSHSI